MKNFPNGPVAYDVVWMVGYKARLRELHFWIFHGTVFPSWESSSERSGEYDQNSLEIIQILTTDRHHGELGTAKWHQTHFLRMEWPEYLPPHVDDFQHFHLSNSKTLDDNWYREYGKLISPISIYSPWASCQIHKIACCACARNAGDVFPATAG